MISRGLETAAKGMLSLIKYNDTIANNIANVNTTGFKKANLVFKNIYDSLVENTGIENNPKFKQYREVGNISMGSEVQMLLNQFSQGNLVTTGNPLDIGIEGDGFFKLRSSDGQISYTRNGSFTINNKNILVDGEGNQVLDIRNKPIVIDLNQGDLRTKGDISITEEGIIELNMTEGKIVLQQIGIYDFYNKEDLKSIGSSRFIPQNTGFNPEILAEKYSIRQGTIESSNSNIIQEMVNMINVSRNYETLAKFIKNDADNITKAINIARVNS